MPKIINHDSISIESITDKLNGLQSQFTALEKKHSVLQDSIQSLNQTIIRADIKTNFFTDQLAFQLFCFSVILVTLSFFSWKWIINPISKVANKANLNVNQLKNEEIPKITSQYKTDHEEQKTLIEDESAYLTDQINLSLSWGLKSMILYHRENKDINGLVIFCLRYMELILKDSNEAEMKKSDWLIDYINDAIQDNSYTIEHYNSHKAEIDKVCELIKKSDFEKYKTFYYGTLIPFFNNGISPTTALEVTESDDLIPAAGSNTK